MNIRVLAVSLFLILAPAALLRPAEGAEAGAISGARAAPTDPSVPAMASFIELMSALAALCGGTGGGICGSVVATSEAFLGAIWKLISDTLLACWALCNSICGCCGCVVFCSGLSISAVIYAITDFFASCGAWICSAPCAWCSAVGNTIWNFLNSICGILVGTIDCIIGGGMLDFLSICFNQLVGGIGSLAFGFLSGCLMCQSLVVMCCGCIPCLNVCTVPAGMICCSPCYTICGGGAAATLAEVYNLVKNVCG